MQGLKPFLVAVAIGCAFAAPPASADDLHQLVTDMLSSNQRMAAASSDMEGARNLVEVARGGWYPTLTPTINYGYEHYNKPTGSDDTAAYRNEYIASLKQLVWDFGAVNANIDRASATYKQSESIRDAVRQGLMLEGVSAYANVVRAQKQLSFARESEANIRRQTGLEEAKVTLGSGLSSDVLQAKAQLSGAEAARVQAEFAQAQAQNRFHNIFSKSMENAQTMVMPKVPRDRLPASQADALTLARSNSPSVQAAAYVVDAAKMQRESTKASAFFPKIEMVAEARNKRNAAGTLGTQQESVAKIEAFDGRALLNLAFS